MIDHHTHQGRWTQTMRAAPCAISPLARLRAWLRAQRNPRRPGRRSIDPAQPWGHWAAGWTSPVTRQKAP